MEIIKEMFPANVPGMKLNNGAVMPQVGLGVFHLEEGDDCYNAVMTALKDGYRHIDTAHAYSNERSVGRAVKDSGIPREQIWITSKLWPNEYGSEQTPAAIERMLKRLDVDYIDLLYLHQPVGDYVGGYKAMEQALKDGKLRAIGISNFDFSDSLYHSLVDNVELTPDAMQIECHPYDQRKHWKEVLNSANIVLESTQPTLRRDINPQWWRNHNLVIQCRQVRRVTRLDIPVFDNP
ncbi:MAG: aldo/keto reductase [Muribaculaceae bacterium]|nr:aldo/keto reductase [Muribaculaceae bacterium]